jgi:UDP-N-acetylglucosamine--N-acetylmuramyl-(pentapeptide) pyrophosphoryl-undecaprenol N-acetylglucosamine transferase
VDERPIGATTVAELTALAVPSVLVPLPGAPGDHQTKNAVAVVEAGGALIIADSTCTGAALGEALDTILDPATLAMMSALAATLGRKDAAGSIARVVRAVGGLT